MKRVLTLALAAFVAVTAALIPAGAASAHAGPHVVYLDVSMTIKDADWPDGDDYAYPKWTRQLKINVDTPSASTQFEGCADEVRVLLDVLVSHNPSPFANGDVSVQTKTRLYEGASCSTTDLEKSTNRAFVAREYVGYTDSYVISDSGGDSASIRLRVN
jgi:hypothetical protein